MVREKEGDLERRHMAAVRGVRPRDSAQYLFTATSICYRLAITGAGIMTRMIGDVTAP